MLILKDVSESLIYIYISLSREKYETMIIINDKHPVLTLYEKSKILIEGIFSNFWRENPLKLWTLKVPTH